MYAIVRTGSKQYKVQAGDFLNVEKISGEVGDKVSLEVIFVSDGGKVTADPKAAAATKVEAEIVEQFKDKKVVVFKFKKRKNYQRKVGHRQQLTRLKVLCVGDEVAKEKKKPAKKAAAKTTTAKKKTEAKPKAAAKDTKAEETKPKKTTSSSTKKATSTTKKTTTTAASKTKKATEEATEEGK